VSGLRFEMNYLFFRCPAILACVLALSLSSFAQNPLASRVEIPGGAQPQLTVGTDGRVWLVYGQFAEAPVDHAVHAAHSAPADGQKPKGHQPPTRAGDVFVACSKDGGATFAPPVKVAHVPKLMLGMRRGPRIAVRGDRLTVTLIGEELFAFSSNDGGKSWSGPATINEVPTCAREGLHDLAGASDGRLFVTWLDLRNGKMELWGADSTDGGRTWAKNAQLYRSPDKSICECCHPSALFDADGNLAIMWRNSIEGSRDMWLATRAKGAKQFTAARKLGEGTWKLNGCPMDGGGIVALGGGRFGAVWQRNNEVFLTREGGAEVKLGEGKQPVAIQTGAAETRVWWQQGAGLVSLPSLQGSNLVKQASDGRFPSVVALPGGRGVLLAYEKGAKGATSVTVERL
jgi:hypothetical protein